LQHFHRIPLLATAIPHHTFHKLPPRQARKVVSKLRNRADHVIMPVNQSSSFRRFHSANYFPHSAFLQTTHSRKSKQMWGYFPSATDGKKHADAIFCRVQGCGLGLET